MPLTGLADIALTVGLVGVIWIAGALLIKADELIEFRRTAARRALHAPRSAALRTGSLPRKR